MSSLVLKMDLAEASARLKQERNFLAPLTIEPVSTTVFSGGTAGHVFAAHP